MLLCTMHQWMFFNIVVVGSLQQCGNDVFSEWNRGPASTAVCSLQFKECTASVLALKLRYVDFVAVVVVVAVHVSWRAMFPKSRLSNALFTQITAHREWTWIYQTECTKCSDNKEDQSTNERENVKERKSERRSESAKMVKKKKKSRIYVDKGEIL